MLIIHSLVEGDIDEAAAAKIILSAGHEPGVCFGKRGFPYIKGKIRGFNQAARGSPYLTLVDFMDTGLDCPPEVVEHLLPHRNPRMLLRVVVREIESWLLSDRQNIAKFLHISVNKVPESPELLPDPKLTLVNLARHSRSSKVRTALVPDQGSTAQVGKLYTSEIKRFINETWDVQEARKSSPSLNRCLRRIESL